MVSGVHSLSVDPGRGGSDSHSIAEQATDAVHRTFAVNVAACFTNSLSSHSVCGAHSVNEWLASGLYVPLGHCLHVLLDWERYSPALQPTLVVVVDVVVVVVVVVVLVVVTTRAKFKLRILMDVPSTKSGSSWSRSGPLR